ncbi:unnamed protein product [Allacma fusca]|uniref:Uncharacterized protein n=1 Tax=Allacma fusca TaxID=39272 RepID=A0A8J2PQY9_9HEXA|nr:unnamed protein product [Allacma fusca]
MERLKTIDIASTQGKICWYPSPGPHIQRKLFLLNSNLDSHQQICLAITTHPDLVRKASQVQSSPTIVILSIGQRSTNAQPEETQMATLHHISELCIQHYGSYAFIPKSRLSFALMNDSEISVHVNSGSYIEHYDFTARALEGTIPIQEVDKVKTPF